MEAPAGGLVVELSALGAQQTEQPARPRGELELELGMLAMQGAAHSRQRTTPEPRQVADYHLAAASSPTELTPTTSGSDGCRPANGGEDDSELCYWFSISEQLQMKINGSLVKSRESSSWKRERLVEAELHLFKLLPDAGASAAHSAGKLGAADGNDSPLIIGRRRGADQSAAGGQRVARSNSGSQQTGGKHREARADTYHLKTNLLEVSLYQILPVDKSSATAPPLRLLDIRRMDLHSTGWETFYVKRALEDWVRDSRLNLGLVIKAKSMLDEPIRVGLVRFAGQSHETGGLQRQLSGGADTLNHPPGSGHHNPRSSHRRSQGQFARDPMPESAVYSRTGRRQDDNRGEDSDFSDQAPLAEDSSAAGSEFNLSHQPILVVYTTSAD